MLYFTVLYFTVLYCGQNGVFSMLPYLFLFVVMMSTGFVSDSIISRRLLTVVTSRKLFTVIGL